MRLFVALELSEDIKRQLGAFQRELAARLGHPSVRWVKPEQLHLTLLFLAERPAEQLSRIEAVLQRAARQNSPFTLETQGFGAFPSLKRPSVLWVGVGGDLEALHSLQRHVALELAWLGLADDKRFRPHLTLARVKGLSGALAVAGVTPPSLPWPITRLTLFESTLSPHGARYRQLKAFELAGAP